MSDPSTVIELIEAFRRSKCMFTATTLGIFDRTPCTLATLAKDLNADPDALERLLCGCASIGLLLRDGDQFRNTDAAETYLKRSSPDTLAGYVLYSDRVLYPMWGNLGDAVREGTHRWKQTFDLDGPIFSHFFRTEDARLEFMLGMHGLGQIGSPLVVKAFDLSGFKKLVDLGGATGHLPMAAAAQYPRLQVALFDLPPVVESAKRFVDSRVELIAGDFFLDPLPPADLYTLGRILHDWSEDKIRILLKKVHESLPPGGALLIIERLLWPDGTGPVSACMQSLNMLTCTEGKERTVAQYDNLLREAGFDRIDAATSGGPVDAILAHKS